METEHVIPFDSDSPPLAVSCDFLGFLFQASKGGKEKLEVTFRDSDIGGQDLYINGWMIIPDEEMKQPKLKRVTGGWVLEA